MQILFYMNLNVILYMCVDLTVTTIFYYNKTINLVLMTKKKLRKKI